MEQMLSLLDVEHFIVVHTSKALNSRALWFAVTQDLTTAEGTDLLTERDQIFISRAIKTFLVTRLKDRTSLSTQIFISRAMKTFLATRLSTKLVSLPDPHEATA